MDSESVDYKALFEQVSNELTDLKIKTWAKAQRPGMLEMFKWVARSLARLEPVELVAIAMIISIGLHYHYWLWEQRRHD